MATVDDEDGHGPHHGGCHVLPGGFLGVRGLFGRWYLVAGPGSGRRQFVRNERETPQPSASDGHGPSADRLRTIHEPAVHEDIRQREGGAEGTAPATVLGGRLGHPSVFEVQVRSPAVKLPRQRLFVLLLNIG